VLQPPKWPHGFPGRERAGFTLIELLVALAVLGMAVTIGVSLYFASVGVCRSNRSDSTAAAIAEEQLAVLVSSPSAFVWDSVFKVPAGELAPVSLKGAKDPRQPQPAEIPGTVNDQLPPDVREAAFFKKFTWEAFARTTVEEPDLVEVTVAVRWMQEGKPRCVTLTSGIPRFAAEGRL